MVKVVQDMNFFIVNYPINKSFGKNLGQITLEQAKRNDIFCR